jgi:hypothetical protein
VRADDHNSPSLPLSVLADYAYFVLAGLLGTAIVAFLIY